MASFQKPYLAEGHQWARPYFFLLLTFGHVTGERARQHNEFGTLHHQALPGHMTVLPRGINNHQPARRVFHLVEDNNILPSIGTDSAEITNEQARKKRLAHPLKVSPNQQRFWRKYINEDKVNQLNPSVKKYIYDVLDYIYLNCDRGEQTNYSSLLPQKFTFLPHMGTFTQEDKNAAEMGYVVLQMNCNIPGDSAISSESLI